MAYFPFFMEIKGQKGVIAGGGQMALHKVEKLLPFEPELTVIAPDILPELLAKEGLTCVKRAFQDADIEGAMFVIAATKDEALNAHISRICQEKQIPVNAVDNLTNCTFLFPALIQAGKLTIGISTAGGSPQTAALLRSRIAAGLPAEIDRILDYLASLREPAKQHITNGKDRAAFLKDIASVCLEEGRIFGQEDTETLLAQYSRKDSSRFSQRIQKCEEDHVKQETQDHLLTWQSVHKPGVTLVGAGCGSYDLITLRGLQAVRRAEVLLYDDLVDERLLEHTSESCERIYVGKRKGKHSLSQEAINQLLIDYGVTGKRVVRLKGGDPYVFGRGGEEVLALQQAKIPVEVVPGVTSAVAAPSAAGIPVTHRGVAKSFHVVTGHTAGEGDQLDVNLEGLAKLEGTYIFLMGLSHLEQIVRRLEAGGASPRTPAAVVHVHADGKVEAVVGVLQDIVEKTAVYGIQTPAVIVVGETAGLGLNP